MTSTRQPTDPASSAALDRQDERLRADAGIRGALTATVDRIRSGDLGVLPVVAGLIVIWTVFQILNPVFLSPTNLVNLTMECVAVGTIALGVVCVLLVGQIDLSVGSVSGLAAAITAVAFVQQGWPLALAITSAVLAGSAVGGVYALMATRLGVPSFVATLAGLLAILGVQLWLLGAQGAINLPFTSPLVFYAQLAFVPEWLSYVLVVGTAGALFASRYTHARKRAAAGLSTRSTPLILAESGAVLVGLLALVWYLNLARGLGWMFVVFVAMVVALNHLLRRTGWGRAIYAVGGNAEAARRAGIRVNGILVSAFVLCSGLAALGGVLAAARLAAANQSTGTADVNLNAIAAAVIGGTSLFGGRGSAFAALLGVVVIQSISSGLTLLNLDSSFRFMVTGLVLALAVALDSVARRSRASHGRA